jgi:Reverse transcriptase (RNA-dependent DNA polymerase)
LSYSKKKSDTHTITQYRHISLINYSIKIIIKLLTKRLSLLMNSLIAPTQTVYIRGRYIMDNVVCAHEALHTIKKKLRVFFSNFILKKLSIEFIEIFY